MTTVVKLYDVVRSAHLERIREDVTTFILYASRRYDYDEKLAARFDVRRRGVLGALVFTLLHDIDVLEISEPLVVQAAPRALAAILGSRIRSVLRRRPPARVVTYAIENKDPRESLATLPYRSRLKWTAWSLLVPHVWKHTNRVAFGTDGAHHLYRAWFPSGRWPEHAVVPAVPAPHPCAIKPVLRREPVVAFLGDLSPRKGFPLVTAAWEEVVESIPDAQLLVIGKGKGEAAAQKLAACHPNVALHIDPPREKIMGLLSQAKVLTLPSQRTPRWREQVGLPIVEGLSVGCEIVTTQETGIADWLSRNGHRVVAAPTSVETLVSAIVDALRDTRGPAAVLASLPAIDGRRAADDWLLAELV